MEGAGVGSGERAEGRELGAERSGDGLRSPLAYVVLGLVIELPSYGYEIGQRLEARFPELLSASTSVYGVLGRLADAGLIERMAGVRATGSKRGARPGPSYRATKDGARAYRSRLVEQLREDPRRIEWLAQMAVMSAPSPEIMLDVIGSCEEAWLLDAQATRAPAQERGLGEERFAGLADVLLAELRRCQVDARVKWVAFAREQVSAYQASRGSEEE